MDDSLTPPTAEELAEIIQHGRINARKTSNRRKSVRKEPPILVKATPTPSKKATVVKKEPNSEWLRSELAKTERNISTSSYDKRRKSDMHEASKF